MSKHKVFINEERRARIPHPCSYCGKQIEVGTRYRYVKGVYKKTGFYLLHICEECYEGNENGMR